MKVKKDERDLIFEEGNSIFVLTFIRACLSVGANPKDIIYANPAKGFKHLEYAKEQNVKKMTFDNKEELGKIQKAYPDAELVLRIAANDSKVCHSAL